MPATQVLAAVLAMAAVNFELADDGLAWNLGLKLLIQMILDDIAAALGTLLGQGSIERFINAAGWRWFAMGVIAVLVALLAARLLGILFRFALGERSGLSFGGSLGFLDTLLQGADGFLKERVLLTELLIFEEQLLIRQRVHADLDSDIPCQLYEIIAIFRIGGKKALNNHHLCLRLGPRADPWSALLSISRANPAQGNRGL